MVIKYFEWIFEIKAFHIFGVIAELIRGYAKRHSTNTQFDKITKPELHINPTRVLISLLCGFIPLL